MSRPELLTVLVVSGGGFQGQGIVRSLRDCGNVRVVLADFQADNLTRHLVDAFARVAPIATGRAFVGDLLALCRAEQVDLVIPATQLELATLARERAAFESLGVRLALPHQDLLATLGDKRRLHRWLAELDVPVLALLDAAQDDVALPIFGRPVAGWGSRGVRAVRSREQLLALSAEQRSPAYVWQPLLEAFEELSVDFAIDFQGRPSPLGVRRRVSVSSGFAVVSQTRSPSPAEARILARVVSGLAESGGHGLFNLQLLVSDSGCFVSDVNPRAGTSSTHWCGTPINPLLHLCRDLAGEPGALPPRIDAGRRTLRVLTDVELPLDEERPHGIEAVVFDLDDTLIDHKAWILSKLEAVHAAHRDELPPRAAFLREAMWLLEEDSRRADLLDAVCRRVGSAPDLAPRLVESWRGATVRACRVHPDVRPTLASLRRGGLKLALLTDNPPRSQREKLAAAGLDDQFDAVVFAREAGAEKPDARPFEAVAHALAMPKASLASVGDNPYRDVFGALAAGYGAAFQVRRSASLSSFDPGIAASLAPVSGRYPVLSGLQPLLWWLGLL